MSETTVQSPLHRVARRWLRAAGAALAAFLLVTCSSDSPVGPGRRGIGSVRVAPVFDAFARVAPLTLDGVRVIVVRPPAETLAVVPKPFNPSSTQLQLNIPVFLQSVSEDLLVTLELYSGQTLLFSGTRTLRVTQGSATPPDSIPVAYQGPGSQVAALLITPRDTTVSFGAQLPYVVSATDAQAAPVAQYYVSWSTPGAPTGTTIDASGRLTAPSVRDTFYVKAITPNGVIDSTSVIIAATPSALVKASGDGQSGLVGTRLALPLAAQVNGNDGLPVPGVSVTFAAATGGGSVDSATATTDAQGIARTGATLGATVGAQTFTASATGLTPVTFTATGTSGSGAITWTGTTSTDWSLAANWNPAQVPTTANDVTIPVTTNQPVITTSCSAKSLTVNVGATLALGAFNCQVDGDVFADGTISGSGALQLATTTQLRGNVPNLIVSGTVSVAGTTAIAGNLTISNGGLSVLGHKVTVGGALTTQGSGVLGMTSATDTVLVTGAATFGGGDESALLTAGYLKIGGSFGQTSATSGASFAASGTHRTELGAGGVRVINFASPGAGAGTSHFNDLIVSGATGGISIAANTFVNGQLISHPTGATPVIGVIAAIKVLTVGGVDVSRLGIDQNVMTIGAGTITQFDSVAFTNQANGVTQLTINNAGGAAPATFTALSFGVAPTTGRYLVANDLDGATPNALTINMVNASPAAPSPSLFSGTNGAVVNWPPVGPVPGTWTGTVDTSWNTAGNWSDGNVPTATTDVTIPAGTPFAPATSGAVRQVRNLTVQAGATLAMGGGGLSVNGSLDAPGLITGNVASFVLAGTGTVRGNVSGTFFSTTVNGSYTLSGRLVTPGLTINGTLTLAGNTAVVGSSAGDDFQTVNNGRLVMTNPLDSLLVGGTGPSVTFDGASTVGTLTAGVILVNSTGVAGFTQGNTFNDSSYAPSGSHKLVTSATSTMLLSMATPGTGSQFNILDLSAQTGGITLQTPIRVNGLFVSTPSATAPAINGGNRLTTLAGPVQVTGLTLTNAPVAIVGDNPVTFDNVTLQGFINTATQLTVSGSGAASRVFNNLTFTATPTTGFYVSATDTDGAGSNGALTVDLINPTPATDGGHSVTTNGAVINWPSLSPSTVTWTGAVDTDWNKPGNWSPAQVPAALDSVIIPNGLATNPTLTGRAVVASVFQDGRLTLNGGVLQVTRDLIGAAVLNRVTSLTLPTDSLIIGDSLNGNVNGGGSVIGGGGVLVVGGSIGSGLGPVFLTVVLNGTGAQSWVQGTGQQGGILLVRKPSGSVTFPVGVRMDSIDVNTAIPLSGTAIVSERGLATAGSLTFTTLSVAGPLTVGGAYNVGSTTVVPATGVATMTLPVLPYQSLLLDGGNGPTTVSLAGRTTVSGNLSVGGTNRMTLDLNGHTVAVSGTLTTNGLGGSVVRMANPLDSLIVAGNADFSSATPLGLNYMTAGTFVLGGTFNQGSPFGGVPFQAAGTHKTVLIAANPVVTFATPGTANNQNRFQDLTWTGSGTLTQGSGIPVSGTLTTTATSSVTFIGNIGTSRFLQFANIQAAGPLVFDSVRVLAVQTGSGTPIGLGNATFQNLPNNITQLTILHPGLAAGSLTLPNLTFLSSPTTGGLYLSVSDNNTGDGIPLVVDLTAPTPSTDGGFSQATNATINWPSASPSATWTGTASTDWFTGANWSTGQVPAATTDVTIPSGTPNAPVLTNTTTMRNLTVAAGATVDAGSHLFVVAGDLDAQGSILVNPLSGAVRLTGTARTVSGNIGLIDVIGTYTLSGTLTVSNDIIVHGTLTIGGHTAAIGNNLSLFSAGVLVMQNPADTVLVTNQATFAGGATAGLLTEGLLEIRGKLLQNNSGTGFPANSFSASGNHTTRLAGSNPQQVDIFNVGTGPTTSHFANLDVSQKTGSVDFTRFNTVVVEGLLISKPVSTPADLGSSNTATLSVGGVDVNGLTFNALPLIIGSGPITQFDNVTLSAPATAAQLTINHPGQATPFQFNNLQFPVTPTSGRYIVANDLDGPTPDALTINLVNPAPAADGGLTTVTNGAVINWPFNAALHTWTGAADNSWENPLNWTGGGGPGITGDAVIPSGTPNSPVVGSNHQINSLVVLNGATLDLNGHSLTVNNGVDVAGLATSGAAGAFISTSFGPARGTFQNLSVELGLGGNPVTLNGLVSVIGSGNTVFISGDVTLAGNTIGNVQGTVKTFNGVGRLIMSGPSDLVVADSVDFSGGDETGRLTAGVIQTRSLTQHTTPTAFVAGGNHKVVLGGTTPSTIFFTNPANSHFQELDITSVSSALTLGSNVTVAGQLIANTGGTTGATVTGAGFTLTAGGADISAGPGITALTMNGVPMVLSGGTIGSFGNITFSNQSPVGIALTVNNVGAPTAFTFANLNFPYATTAGGFYIQANDLDGATPNALTIDVVGANPATPGGAAQANNGAVINWPPSSVWTGAVNTDWSNPGNWSTGSVPTGTDDVVIPSTANKPAVTSTCDAKSILVNSGGQLNLGTLNCQVAGNVISSGTIIGTTGAIQIVAAGQIQGNFPNLIASAPVTVSGATGLGGGNGNVTITGAGASLNLNGQTLVAPGDLTVTAGGLLVMTNPADVLTIQGNAVFDGGNESGALTEGRLSVFGNFSQQATSSAASFFAGGSHLTVLGGPNSTVSFAASGISRFQELDVSSKTGTLTLGSNVTIAGQLISNTGGGNGPTITGSGFTLTAGGADVLGGATSTALTMDGVPLILSGGAITSFGNVTFTNQSPVGTALTVNNNGTAAPFTFVNLNFTTALTAGGFHIVANDIDGGAPFLTIDVIGATPATGGGFFQANNGAIINWPPVGSLVWTGAVSSDWSNPGNWDLGRVPTIVDDATVGIGTPNLPKLSVSTGINNLTIQGGATVDLDTTVMVVAGNLDNSGSIIGVTGTAGMSIVGVGKTLKGSIGVDVALAGDYTLNGPANIYGVTVTGGSGSGTLVLNGNQLAVTTNFSTANNGTITMNNAADRLTVGGSAFWLGGDENGKLTDGVLQVAGDFTQIALSSTTSFAPSGKHKTVLSSATAQTVDFGSPGLGAAGSHFQVLDLSGAAGGVTLTVNSIADSVISTNAAAKLSSSGSSLTMRRAQISGLTADNTTLILDEQGVFQTENMSGITFQGFGTTGVTMMKVSGPGGTVSARPTFTTNNVNFQSLPIGAGNLYVDLTATNGGFFTLTMTGSNQSPQIGGNGPTNSNPPNQVRVSGALVSWP